MPEAQEAITDAYETIGEELGAIVVPVGVAWQQYRAKHKSPNLYDRDQSHPTLAGTYLAACVFLKSLFAKIPVGLAGPAGLAADDIEHLQAAASKFSS